MVGLTRFSLPVGPTLEKKFERLRPVADLHIVGFAATARFKHRSEPGVKPFLS